MPAKGPVLGLLTGMTQGRLAEVADRFDSEAIDCHWGLPRGPNGFISLQIVYYRCRLNSTAGSDHCCF